jgi:hypothetical protein
MSIEGLRVDALSVILRGRVFMAWGKDGHRRMLGWRSAISDLSVDSKR